MVAIAVVWDEGARLLDFFEQFETNRRLDDIKVTLGHGSHLGVTEYIKGLCTSYLYLCISASCISNLGVLKESTPVFFSQQCSLPLSDCDSSLHTKVSVLLSSHRLVHCQ